MNPQQQDDWLDALLAADAADAAHIADNGFAARVMAALPPGRKTAPRWIVPLATVLGCLVAALFTPAAHYLAQGFSQLLNPQQWSPAHLWVLAPVVVFYGLSFAAVRER